VVVDGRFYLYTERSTVKARNLKRNPQVAVHTESGADVLIVHGVLADRGRPDASPTVVAAFAAKYDKDWEQQFLPHNDPAFDVLYALRPARALTWTLPDSAASTRRWKAVEGYDPVSG
jgi:hypothetical protein